MELTAQRLNAATEALRAMLGFEHPADAVLRAFFREHRALGQRDRGPVAELSFTALRHLRLLETLAGGRQPRRLLLAAAAVIEGRSLRQLEPVLKRDEAQWLAGVRAADTRALPPAVQASLPDWIWDRLSAVMPEGDALALARGLLAPAPLDLRVNSELAEREAVLAALQAEGLAAEPTPYSPLGVRLAEKPALQHHALFRAGKIEVQDEASQLLGWLVAPRRREMVVDFCAGAGGKTLALGALMRSQGRLYAFDTSQRRLANLAPRLKRSGLSNVQPQLIDDEHDARVRRLAGKIDRVLVDAPCTGLGTLRRNPDLKWRQSPQALAELTRKQASILTAAGGLVKPGGRLVYATCSILREENAAIVEAFLAAHPQFALDDASGILRAQGIALDTGVYFRVCPHSHQMDGFFAAVLARDGQVARSAAHQ
ncbi:MAG TPA: RsmB/NOP family class I SAM-dependent RNA methyltransferase [Burkholderiales bacterium]